MDNSELAYEIWALAQVKPGDSILNCVSRIKYALDKNDCMDVAETLSCKCDGWIILDNIPDICRSFVPGEDNKSVCARCEHEIECHAGN